MAAIRPEIVSTLSRPSSVAGGRVDSIEGLELVFCAWQLVGAMQKTSGSAAICPGRIA
jgi:hypothetical protein